jgi:hypothetical protein
MNQPLGDSVGTGLEVLEAVRLLKGEGPEDLQDLVMKLGMEVVRLAGVAGSTLSAKQAVERHLKDGSALEKFKAMVRAQGGKTDWIDDPSKFPKAKFIRKLPAPKRGYVHTINAAMIAKVSIDVETALLNLAKGKVLKTNKTETTGPKPFTFAVTARKVKIPGFTWKAGEGKERLERMREELQKLTEAVEKTLSNLK